MPAAPRPLRVALFCAACAALLAADIGFAGGSPASAPPRRPGETLPVAVASKRRQSRGAVGVRSELGGAAGRFLTAFFRYEVGELGPTVRRALRASATPGFAAELLASPPRRPPGAPAAVLPGHLAIAVASIDPPRALVSGSARRGDQSEQFSFLFEPRRGTWLASGAGE